MQFHDYWDIEKWLLTNKYVGEYSKIQDINSISCCKNYIKNNEKLLLIEFDVLRENSLDGNRYITHKLHIIRTVKNGPIICNNPLYINIDSMELEPNHIKINKRISSSKILEYTGRILNGPYYIMCEYYPEYEYYGSAKYTVKLHEDDLLNDIRTKKQKPIPSLSQLCVLAIATNDLEQYNYMNRTMHLALK